MISPKIKIKNYRCFGHEPQEFEIHSGFTSFIGLNNAGKSAVLKMFYELRNLWSGLALPNTGVFLAQKDRSTITLKDISDVDEIFNHYNSTHIEIIFIFKNEDDSIIEFTLKITKLSPSQLGVTCINFLVNSEPISLHSSYQNNGSYFVRYLVQNGSQQVWKQVDISSVGDFFSKLKESIYIPAFRNVINAGEQTNYYDIATGTAFINQWNAWKGGAKFSRGQIKKIEDDIKRLFNYDDLDIIASEDKKTLRLTINGKPYSLYEIGSGLSQFILAFATAAIKQPSFIFIDEPESNLHPALQLRFLTSLASYASEGIVFATHSVGLARSSAEYVYSITNDGKEAKIKSFSDTPDYLTLLGELSFSAYKEIGANSILFVEGVTEVKTFQELLRKFGKDSKVLIMSLGGSDMINGNREIELSEITNRLKISKAYAYIDSEKKSLTDTIGKSRNDFLEVCKRAGITAKISDKRATENYFTDRAVQTVFGDVSKVSLGDFGVLDQAKDWRKDENWKIAKEMTKKEIESTDLGKFIEDIFC